MKTVVMLLMVIMSTVIYSQNAQQAATIEINGAKLRLGMTKGEVAEKLAGANIHKITEDLWVIGDISPSMQFTAGRLTFADRTWSKTEALAEPLYGVVSAFNEQGYTRCDISADTKVTPGAWQASPLQEKSGSPPRRAALQKKKSPDWHRGALFYTD